MINTSIRPVSFIYKTGPLLNRLTGLILVLNV
jgi:hypothetical protein